MKRRLFLTGLATAFAAPAIVRAESLMKIFVPKHPQWVESEIIAPKPELMIGRGYARPYFIFPEEDLYRDYANIWTPDPSIVTTLNLSDKNPYG